MHLELTKPQNKFLVVLLTLQILTCLHLSVSVLSATLGSTKLHAGLIQAVGPTVCHSERAPMLFIHRGARGVRNIDTLSRDGDFASLLSLALKPGILSAHTGIEGLCEYRTVKLHSSHFASCTCKEKSAVFSFVILLWPNFFSFFS